jgi:hypothetical protein
MIALFTCGWDGERHDPPVLCLRDDDGRWTGHYLRIRTEMGAPDAFLRAVQGAVPAGVDP